MPTQIERAATMAADWWTRRLQRGDRALFREHLRAIVLAELQSCGESTTQCDYDPRDALLEAVRAAGIECTGYLYSADGILPRKTVLIARPDRLSCKEGYGAAWCEFEVPYEGVT